MSRGNGGFLALIGVFCYFTLFGLDPIFAVLEAEYGGKAPVGLLALNVGILLYIALASRVKLKPKYMFALALTILFSAYIFLMSAFSSRGIGEAWQATRYVSVFAISFYASKYVCRNSHIENVFMLFGILFCVVLYYAVDYNVLIQEKKFNYLRVADGVAFLGIAALASSKKFSMSLAMIVPYSAALWIAGSRAAFFVYVASSLLYLFVIYDFRKTAPIFIFIIVGAYVVISQFHETGMYEHRYLRLIESPDSDTSLAVRLNTIEAGIGVIRENFVIGHYMWQEKVYNEFGMYIHNVLSYWAQFGVVGFLLVLLFLLLPFTVFFTSLNFNDFLIRFLLIASVFVLVNVIFAKSYRYDMILLPLGIAMTWWEQSSFRNDYTTKW